MAVKRWADFKKVGTRLAAHRLTGLLSIDLEGSENIGAIGAIRTDRSDTFVWSGDSKALQPAIAALDEFAHGATYLVGHNIIEQDLELLAKHASGLKLLSLLAIDTLYLSPLAFPENPYHHLVKQYQEPALARVQMNDPLLDAELTLELLADIADALLTKESDLLLAWHALLSRGVTGHAFDQVFQTIRRTDTTPLVENAVPAITHRLSKHGCPNQAARIAHDALSNPLALTYLLAWLPTAGGNSIIPPYVEKRFEPSKLAKKLREAHCGDQSCPWCSEHLDPAKALKRWFGFPDFRDKPQSHDGESLQRSITEQHLAQAHVLGILPTGTGKSLCYQLPALMRYEATGALTVVISPLVALMADQVTAMRRQGITCATTINGLISMPERADALAQIRFGDAGIVLVAPEQLRNPSFRTAIAGRRIAAWVIDEAHCLSKWGHDFRPDYRYVSRYIAEHHGEDAAPILCLTATAKHDVVEEIRDHFERTLQSPLEVIDGGAERTNLEFVVMPTSASQRIEHIHQALENALAKEGSGGAIVYCTTKRSTEETAQALTDREISAQHFHSGLSPERKREIQRGFHEGDIDVVVATNAFGMGIHKPDVRAVVHAEIPGSLESYLQEAGRAGRDGGHAHCLLLFEPDDSEKQFSLTARSRLERRDIQAVLRALRRLDQRRRHHHGDSEDAVIATSGEILLQDNDGEFTRDSVTDDDRVRTAIAWLEESKLAQRDENRISVFPSSLLVPSLAAAHERIEREGSKRKIRKDTRDQMLHVVRTLLHANPDTGVSTDGLMYECGCSMQQLRAVFSGLEAIGVASNDMRITVYVHAGVENASTRRLSLARELEEALIAELREEAPDQEIDTWTRLALRPLAQRLREKDIESPLPQRLVKLLRSISADGRDEPDAKRSIEIRSRDMETIGVRLRRNWTDIARIARLRREGAAQLLEHLVGKVPDGVRGVDLLVETTYGALEQTIKADLVLKAELKDQKTQPLVDRALLWMHEQEVITLNKGLSVFRPAMTLKVTRDGRTFTVADFKPLQEHYAEQTAQIHVVTEYAKLGVADIHLALRLAMDYFELGNETFVHKWFKGKETVLHRDTLPQHYHEIVKKLGNRTQERIVADDRERTNVLVLAGPGSGKTRVLVHRIAYLIRVRRENQGSILALTYNRHAAVEARRRLYELIGSDARGVYVMTCHALAMRILGISFAQAAANPSDETFDNILRDATRLLTSDDASAHVTREQMLGRLNWILVDEYQDIGEPEYELIAALAGKTLAEDDARLNLFAVGDDDQNIYGWKGASVRFIRRFAQDYHAKEEYLVENYRSSGYIIDSANQCIEGAAERLKRDHRLLGAEDTGEARDVLRALSVFDEPEATTQSMTGAEVLRASAFQLSSDGTHGAPSWTAWGRFATGGFEADVDGTRLDGTVSTAFLGADVDAGGWLAGAAISMTRGDGEFTLIEGEDRGEVESTLTAAYPYLRLRLSDTVDVWGLAGYGTGDLTLTLLPDSDREARETYRTDIAMRMGAVGIRGEVISGENLPTIVVKSDAFWVQTTSERIQGLMASSADVTRLRLLVEGSRTFTNERGTWTPSIEIGLRHDGGDAETGTGIEAGAGIQYTSGALSIEGTVHTLVAHEDSNYKEWSASGAVRIRPSASGRGLSLTVAPAWGAPRNRGEVWSLAPSTTLPGESEFDAEARVEAELGYGFGLRQAPGVLTPYAGLSVGAAGGRAWRAGTRWQVAPALALGLEATTQATTDGDADNTLMLRVQARF